MAQVRVAYSNGRKSVIAVLMCLVLCVVSSACSSSSGATSKSPAAKKLTTVNFLLNYLPGGAQTGFMYGKSLGIFRKYGININIIPGSGSLTTAELLAGGKNDIGYVSAGTAFKVAAKGGPITVVAPILQTNGYAVIALKSSGITSIKDLVGKSVGVVPSFAPTVSFPGVLAANGLSLSSVHIVDVSNAGQVGVLLDHKVDAIASAGDVQGPEIKAEGYKINEMFYYNNGVPTVGESIVVNNSFLKNHAELVKNFVAASIQSWLATAKNPAAAAAATASQFPAEGTAQAELAQVEVDLGLVCDAPGATRVGEVPNAIWSKDSTIYKRYEGMATDVNIRNFETTRFLSGPAVKCKNGKIDTAS